MKIEFAKGNRKVPETTYILNMGNAKHCPSKKLNLCQCPDICYARKAEISYPHVLPYRNRQRKVFTTQTAEKIAQALLNSGARAKRIKFKKFRYSEAGDFKSQKDVNKLTDICRILTANGIPCSGYTARTDLDLNDLLKVTTVNVSNDKGGWQEQGANRFKTVESYSKDAIKCLGNCRICSICERYKGQTIEVLNH